MGEIDKVGETRESCKLAAAFVPLIDIFKIFPYNMEDPCVLHCYNNIRRTESITKKLYRAKA